MEYKTYLTDEFLLKEFEDLKARISNDLDGTGTTTSGKTKKSLRVEQVKDNYTTITTLYGRNHFATVETGRQAGNIPKNFVEIIREWADKKGLQPRQITPYKRKPSDKWQPKYTPEERARNQMAGAIAFKIKKKGSLLNRTGGRFDIFTNNINITLDRIGIGVHELLISELKEVLQNYFLTDIT